MAPGRADGKVVVAYLSSWAAYRPGDGAYTVNRVHPDLCTHVIYAFAGLDPQQSAIKSLDPWQDLKDKGGKGGYEHLTGFKRSYPHLKVSLAIGGWNEGSKNYSNMVADPNARARFARQATAFIMKYNFDGLDLDWEYPTQRGGCSSDRANFVALCQELRASFNPHGLLLTAAIGASKRVIGDAYAIRALSRCLDFFHVMCYDYHGSWDGRIGYNAPLRGPQGDKYNVQFTIDYLLKLDAPPGKIVMGLPFYGRTYETVGNGNIGDKTEGAGFQGPYTRENGIMGFNEICQELKNNSDWSTSWDGEASQVLARRRRGGRMQVISFDSTRSIANKVKFAMDRKLAGVMIWSIDTDDFQGCSQSDEHTFDDYVRARLMPSKRYANCILLRTINDAITLAIQEAN